MEIVLDPGPIPYAQIALAGDPDLEHGLRHYGVEPSTTTYRLIDIPVDAVSDARIMPYARWRPGAMVEAVDAGVELPPIVVYRNRDRSWSLLDGVNRTHAYLFRRVARTRAYELIEG